MCVNEGIKRVCVLRGVSFFLRSGITETTGVFVTQNFLGHGANAEKTTTTTNNNKKQMSFRTLGIVTRRVGAAVKSRGQNGTQATPHFFAVGFLAAGGALHIF